MIKIFKTTLLIFALFFASVLLNVLVMNALTIFEFEKGIISGLPSPSDSTGNAITTLSQAQLKGVATAEPYKLVDPPDAPASDEGSISATRFFYQPDSSYYFDLDQESNIYGLCMADGRQIDDPTNTECGSDAIRYVNETDNDLNSIQNVACPIDNQDAATKLYVDNIVAGKSGCATP